jgi:hypothetical protein
METLSIDFGAGNIKRYSAGGSAIIPSMVATVTGEQMGTVAGIKSTAAAAQVAINGYKFFVGAGAHNWGRPVENLDDSRFSSGSPELRALIYAALDGVEQENPLHVIVGLPQSALEASQAAATAEGLRAWMEGEHRWTLNNVPHVAQIEKVTISSQAGGALFDYCLDEAGKFTPDRRAKFREEIGIVSVGMNTLELLVVRAGQTINRFTSSRTAGVRRLLELADPRKLYSRGELDSRLRAKKLNTDSALPIWSAEVIGHIEQGWEGAHKRFASIVVVGGGAMLLKDDLTKFFNGRGFFPDDPVMSVARGLYKWALIKRS